MAPCRCLAPGFFYLTYSRKMTTPLFSFPMANGRDVKFPRLGVTLACVNPSNCETSHPFRSGSRSGQGYPSLYGSKETPYRFQYHSPGDCTMPRTATFENLQDYWSQDFLQTFSDCLKDSDFNVSAPQLLNVSKVQTFAGSSRTSILEDTDYSNSYPYQCCFSPSYYQVSVRGSMQSTAYFNPLFSSCHDFNCSEEENCMGHGAVDFQYPRATPHSVLWYLLHSLAKVSDEENTVTFWDAHQVGRTHTTATLAAQLGYGLGDPQVATLASLIGTHDMAARLLSDRSTGACGLSVEQTWKTNYSLTRLFCPFASSDQSVWRDYILNYSTNFIYHTSSEDPLNSVWPITAFENQGWQPLIWDTPQTVANPNAGDLDFRLKSKLECCTRADPTSNFMRLYTFSSNTNGKFSATVIGGFCESFLCPTSPICHALLHSFCSNPVSLTSKYCQSWHAWAATSYASTPIFNLPTTSLDPATPPLPLNGLPWGAYSSGVDTSLASLLAACSVSRATSQVSKQYEDMCSPLFTSTYQANFPRLRVFQFGDFVTYTTDTNFQMFATDLTVSLDLKYAAYSYTDNQDKCNILMRGPAEVVIPSDKFLCMPIGLSARLALLTLSATPLQASNYADFVALIRQKFNDALASESIKGKFYFPPPPTSSFTQYYLNGAALYEFSQTYFPAYPNHATDIAFWDPITNNIGISHTTIQTSTASRFDANRQENVNFLYSISTLQVANNWRSSDRAQRGFLVQNCSFDQFPIGNQLTLTMCGLTEPRFTCTVLRDFDPFFFVARIPQGVATADFTSYLNSPIPTVIPKEGVPSTQVPLNLEYLPTLTINFSKQVQQLLGLDASPQVVINPIAMNGGLMGVGTYNFAYTTPFQGVAPTQLHQVVTRAVFNITNTSTIPFTNLSVLNYDINNYSVSLGSTNIQPQQTTQITVSINRMITEQNIVTTPVFLYDSVSWQGSLTSLDYPVLGGFQIVQGNFTGIVTTAQNPVTPYMNGMFSSFQEDEELGENGVSYLSNQNVYGLGAQSPPLPVGFRIVPLV